MYSPTKPDCLTVKIRVTYGDTDIKSNLELNLICEDLSTKVIDRPSCSETEPLCTSTYMYNEIMDARYDLTQVVRDFATDMVLEALADSDTIDGDKPKS